jgi:hypothetical protein
MKASYSTNSLTKVDVVLLSSNVIGSSGMVVTAAAVDEDDAASSEFPRLRGYMLPGFA